jgi:Quinohemoprotein amine dehydrogenase, alpha subunit domain III
MANLSALLNSWVEGKKMAGPGRRVRLRYLLLIVGCLVLPHAFAQAPATPATDVPSDAAAQIAKVTPDSAAAGSSVTIEIAGSNFSAGVYVSFSTPAVRVVSASREDASKLQASLEVNPSAQAGSVTLYVSNPAGAAAQTSFTILPSTAPSPPPAPGPSPNPASVTQEKNAPVVTSVEPARLAPGSRTTLKIKGKGLMDGATVSFSNPGIQVLATRFSKSKELEVDIQVAADAATGTTSLFVVNPDDSEVEHPFEIAAGNPTTTLPAATSTATTTTSTNPKVKGANEQSFDVYNLGDAKTIFQNPTQAKGTLILAGKELRYEEGGKVVFSAAAAEVQEIAPNVVFGINTATFHVILKSSKTYNFVSASLRPADTQTIVDSLRRALQ